MVMSSQSRNIAERMLDATAAFGKSRVIFRWRIGAFIFGEFGASWSDGLGALHGQSSGTFLEIVLVAPIGHLFNSIPLTPGDVGVGETAFKRAFCPRENERGSRRAALLPDLEPSRWGAGTVKLYVRNGSDRSLAAGPAECGPGRIHQGQ
jgi:hypothetical protein